MKITPTELRKFLPNLNWSENQLMTNLTLIGHETEKSADVLEVKIFPNRGDCLSSHGLCRDLTGNYPELGKLNTVNVANLPTEADVVELNVTESARKYLVSDLLLKIEGYIPTKSPVEIIETLQLLGMQPKDLAIDLTNLLTFELGLPLHVFDFEKVQSGLIIDLSAVGESIELINKKALNLEEGLLIQRSANQIVDLAGVMGASNSATSNTSTTLLIQAAVFEPTIVRKNSLSTGVSTEASYRYQRGVDPEIALVSLGRMLFLLQKYCPTVKAAALQNLLHTQQPTIIDILPEMISKLLGTDVSDKNIAALGNLGFDYTNRRLTVPSWRRDIQSIADVSEEVAKVIGIDKITPKELSKQREKSSAKYENILSAKLALIKAGFSEISSLSFVDKGGKIKIRNPRTDGQSELRSSLLAGMLEALSKNPYLKRVNLYEVGHVFLPEEDEIIGFITTGYKEAAVDKIAQQIQKLLKMKPNFTPVETSTLEHYNVKQPKVWFAQISVKDLETAKLTAPLVKLPVLKPISKFPPILRDLTFVVDKSLDRQLLLTRLQETELVLIAEQVDEFSSVEALGDDRVALTYRLTFQADHRSLVDSEVSLLVEKRLNNLKKEVNFEIR